MTSAGGSDAEALDEEHNEGSLLLGGGPRHRRARAGTSGGRTGGGDDGGGGEKSGGLDAAYAVIGECGLAQVPAFAECGEEVLACVAPVLSEDSQKNSGAAKHDGLGATEWKPSSLKDPHQAHTP